MLNPSLAAQWHPTKNAELTPDDVRPGSFKKVWWRCSRDPAHEWEATVANRTKGRGCPICAGKKVSPSTSLRAQHPKLAAEWHPTQNGSLTPDDVRPGSNKKVWWQCPANPSHEWQATVVNRVKGRGCNACLGRSATTATSLRATHRELAAEWHLTKNGDLTPDDVVAGSGRTVWWQCRANQTHEWQAVIRARVKRRTSCPFCRSLAALRPEIAA